MQNLNKLHIKNEQLANNWLKENGITNKLFNETQVFQLQAYKTATNILRHIQKNQIIFRQILTDKQL